MIVTKHVVFIVVSKTVFMGKLIDIRAVFEDAQAAQDFKDTLQLKDTDKYYTIISMDVTE